VASGLQPRPAMKIFGIALIVVGLVALAFGGISWTKREKIVDIGPIHAEAEKRQTIPLPPVFGGVAVVAGIALIAVSRRNP
jgi:UDP-N-acetylmuramyl pentapeptide phosphotransferase/UDP-N-acetylglucosamine-1-phosphate transferase